MKHHSQHVIIGVDPHKLSTTIEVVDEHEQLLGSGRFTTDRVGYTAMRARAYPRTSRVLASPRSSNGTTCTDASVLKPLTELRRMRRERQH